MFTVCLALLQGRYREKFADLIVIATRKALLEDHIEFFSLGWTTKLVLTQSRLENSSLFQKCPEGQVV
jgi:hypothetical protein